MNRQPTNLAIDYTLHCENSLQSSTTGSHSLVLRIENKGRPDCGKEALHPTFARPALTTSYKPSASALATSRCRLLLFALLTLGSFKQVVCKVSESASCP